MYTFVGTFLSCGIILFIAVFVAGYFFHKKVKGDSGAKTMVVLSVFGILLFLCCIYTIFIHSWDGCWSDWIGIILHIVCLGFMVYALIRNIRDLKKSQEEK